MQQEGHYSALFVRERLGLPYDVRNAIAQARSVRMC